ncbi:MAG: carboxymuconolactone decarboxylase family protein, partial [Candidatus Krumholzibacteria bacterium]|nr:carboxymuconolactone decarboxylase family protein [Candidatus Krumholzibacteria bacterium]
MKSTMRLIASAIALSIAIFASSTSALAQSDATKKAEAEMKATFGTVPVMMRVYPERLRAGAWEWFKATMSPDAAVPSKFSQLISLAVASQIPCAYCVYAHTTMAKMFGAT